MSAAWWDKRLIGFDVESSGVDVETDRIVTAAVVACGGGIVTESLTLLADPGIEISPGTIEVHGITNERARARKGYRPPMSSRPSSSPWRRTSSMAARSA